MHKHSGGMFPRGLDEGQHGEGMSWGPVVGPHGVVVLDHGAAFGPTAGTVAAGGGTSL